ncbi:MAG: PA14 domain-containing protein [Anaerolineae bacterium]
MKIKLTLCGLLFAAVLFLVGNQPAEAAEVWQARYYNNKLLWGAPVLVRNESGLNHDWGDGSPSEDVYTDNFSAEWITTTYFDEGTYRFFATVDDGMKVYIDGEVIIDVWYDSQEHTTNTDVHISKGNHNLKVEYYEAGGPATAKVSWEKVAVSSGGSGIWNAEYFNNISLSGTPALTQNESQINNTWLGVPATGVNADGFSVRWSADIPVEAGTYRFTTRTDDGVRLWVGGQKIIDQWQLQPATLISADITLTGGTVPVKMEYYDNDGVALAVLNWSKFDSAIEAQVVNNASSQVITDWKGEYFNNSALLGAPAVTRNDPAINWNWGTSSPIPNVLPEDFFSVRWTKTVNMDAGTYLFRVYADDGARVYVNDEIVIDSWERATGNWLTGTFTVEDGSANIRVEYLEMNLMAEIWAGWEPVNGAAASSSSSTTTGGTTNENVATLIDAGALTIRSGPDRTFDPVGYIIRNEQVTLLGRDSITYWIKIQHADGTIGWSSGKFLSSTVDFSTLPILDS